MKKILIGLGIAFVVLAVVAVFFVYSFADFRQQHEAFVRQFMSDYSRRWEVADVHRQVTAEFLEQIGSPNAVQAVALFRRLGRVRAITDLSVENITKSTNGNSGVFLFKAEFDNAPAVVRLTLRVSGGAPQVHHLSITSVSEPTPSGPQQTDV